MLEKDLGGGWIGEAGYVGNRALRLQNRWQTNYGYIGGGSASQVLNKKFGRTAGTILSMASGFRSQYDSLQSTLQRRFSRGYTVRLSYTWSKAIGPPGTRNGLDTFQNSTPEYWPLIAHVVQEYDITHNFNAAVTAELPFGRGKRWATEGFAAALLGRWQINALYTGYTGTPFSVTASGTSLNAPGNSQTADQIKPDVAIFGQRALWFDTTAYKPVTEVRFGTSGRYQIRGPGMNNLDLSVYRSFGLTERMRVQFRAEAFNVSNTPHFGTPRADASGSLFGEISGVANTGREGIDERVFRFALHLDF
jgi:hypothetical protein